MTTDLSRFVASQSEVAAALAAAKYDPPHGEIHQLSQPLHLVHGDIRLPELVLHTGSLVVIGALTLTGPADVQQSGRPIVNIIVTGDCTMPLAYIDGFLCVGGNLKVGTLIADSNFAGGVFVAGDLTGHTLVIKDMGVDVDGTQHVERIGDCDDPEAARREVEGLYPGEADEPDPRQFFAALRDSFGKTPSAATAL